MKDDFLDVIKENITIKISLILILSFPIILLLGSAIINISIVLMNIFFLTHVVINKKYQIFRNEIFYLLIALWFFLILNTLLNEGFHENYSRSFSFVRFIILILSFTYFFTYKDSKFRKLIFNFWTIIFIIVTLDLIFEYFLGFNTLGFKSPFSGRLVGFMGEQLKIGHWYLCFALIILANYFNHNKIFYLFLIFSIITSFIIGERANFFRLFIALTMLIIFLRIFSFKTFLIFLISGIIIYFITTNYHEDKNNKFKDRYITQIFSVLKMNSIMEINNSNSYTPMFFNAYGLFKQNKLFGVGVGSYLEQSHQYFRANKMTSKYRILPNTHPHQFHFEILATLGLPGYLFISFFLLYFLFKGFYSYTKNKDIINLTSFLFIFVFCIPLLPTGSFFTTYGASIFWLNFSLMNLGCFKNID